MAKLSPSRRGYGAYHRALRERWKPLVKAGLVRCARCELVIEPGALWELDHAAGKQGYLGPSHRRCNRRAGGKEGAAITNAKRGTQLRWSRQW